jgi:hypothetical protein
LVNIGRYPAALNVGAAMPTTFPFSLHGAEGAVSVSYVANEDPERWGYGLLDLSWPSSLALGLPVLEARVSSSLEGYAAVMAWIQVVRIHVSDVSTSLVANGEKAPPGDHSWVDGPPHLRGLGIPFVSFGYCPTLFDAPASTESDIRFVADSFLTASPDALISRRSEACAGVRWGYSTEKGQTPELRPITQLNEKDWAQALPILEATFPDWDFGTGWLS